MIAKAGGKVFLPVPFDPDVEWGPKALHRVGGDLGGCRVRGTIEEFAGQRGLRLPPSWMRDAPVEVGMEVEASLEPEGPQRDDLPEDVAAALEASPAAGAFFDSLAQFYRKGYLSWISATKRSPEERQRRIAETVKLLEAGTKQRPR